jgi:hypothetical protein
MATLEKRVYDADQARQVLENEAFAKAFSDIEQEYSEAWKNSPARDAGGREEIWKTIKLLHKLRLTLESAMQDGTMARIEIEHQQKLATQDRSQDVNVTGWN